MAQTKPAGAWRYEDLFALPDDGRRWEIVDGELYEVTSPSWAHQRVLGNLFAALLSLVERLGGVIQMAPLDVFFAGADPVQHAERLQARARLVALEALRLQHPDQEPSHSRLVVHDEALGGAGHDRLRELGCLHGSRCT